MNSKNNHGIKIGLLIFEKSNTKASLVTFSRQLYKDESQDNLELNNMFCGQAYSQALLKLSRLSFISHRLELRVIIDRGVRALGQVQKSFPKLSKAAFS